MKKLGNITNKKLILLFIALFIVIISIVIFIYMRFNCISSERKPSFKPLTEESYVKSLSEKEGISYSAAKELNNKTNQINNLNSVVRYSTEMVTPGV